MLFSASLPLFFLALVALSDALYAPRSRHLAHVHHAAAIRARVPAPEALPVPVPAPIANASLPRRVRKRQSGKCRQRPTSAVPSSSSSTAAAPSSSEPPRNVAPKPTTQVQTSQAPPSSTSHSSTSTSASTSTFIAPAPPKTSTQHTTQAPAPTTSAAPKPTTSASGNSGGGGGGGLDPFPGFFEGPNEGGDGTFYTPGLGACGQTNDESQLVAALPFGLFNSVPGYNGANPNQNPVCGKFITISYNGKSVRVKVVDECAGCNNPKSVDMSPAAFNQLADPSVGRLHDISWVWS